MGLRIRAAGARAGRLIAAALALATLLGACAGPGSRHPSAQERIERLAPLVEQLERIARDDGGG